MLFVITNHALTRGGRAGIDCQKRSRSGLCAKPPDRCSVGDIALNPTLCVNKVNICLRYRIISSWKLFLSMYSFVILTMRLSAWRDWVTRAN